MDIYTPNDFSIVQTIDSFLGKPSPLLNGKGKGRGKGRGIQNSTVRQIGYGVEPNGTVSMKMSLEHYGNPKIPTVLFKIALTVVIDKVFEFYIVLLV